MGVEPPAGALGSVERPGQGVEEAVRGPDDVRPDIRQPAPVRWCELAPGQRADGDDDRVGQPGCGCERNQDLARNGCRVACLPGRPVGLNREQIRRKLLRERSQAGEVVGDRAGMKGAEGPDERKARSVEG